jgi:hypothetical protein
MNVTVTHSMIVALVLKTNFDICILLRHVKCEL